MPSVTRLVAATALVATLSSGLAACSLADFGSPQRSFEFESYGEAPKSGTRSFVLAGWVPSDATAIRAVARRDDPEEAVLAFRTVTPLTGVAGCAPADPLESTPSLAPEWWPSDLPTSGVVCGDWSAVTTADGEVYAWRDAAPTQAVGTE
jgi:hypothetical protein